MDFIERCRDWQKAHPDWELLCDIKDVDSLYIQWRDLSRRSRRYWIGIYGAKAREAFELVGPRRCKVPVMVLNIDLRMLPIEKWPDGSAMTIYQTNHGKAS